LKVRIAALLAGGEGRRLGGVAKEGLSAASGTGATAGALGPDLALRLGEAFETVIVVTKNPALYGGVLRPGDRAVADMIPGFGPLSGLHAALQAARSLWAGSAPPTGASARKGREGGSPDAEGGPWLWLAACDMPAFDPGLVDFLAERLEGAMEKAPSGETPIACLARRGPHFEPFQALYSVRLLPRLEALLAGTKAGRATGAPVPQERDPSFKELFSGQPVLYVAEEEVRRVTPGWELYFNINRPEDLEEWRRRGTSGRGS
jgi:molybdopterin-guanine dinucleotide biosynthesis protein A